MYDTKVLSESNIVQISNLWYKKVNFLSKKKVQNCQKNVVWKKFAKFPSFSKKSIVLLYFAGYNGIGKPAVFHQILSGSCKTMSANEGT